MLEQTFLNLFEMSIAAGYCAIFVIIIRFFMRKLPKSYSYVLWAVVFLRLLMPSLPESDWSLMPGKDFMVLERFVENESVDVGKVSIENEAEVTYSQNNVVSEEVTANQRDSVFAPSPVKPRFAQFALHTQQYTGGQHVQDAEIFKIEPLQIISWVWLVVSAILLVYCVVNNILFEKRLEGAEWVAPNTYELESLQTAFVIGAIKARIYLPSNLPEEYRSYVLAHEQTHMKRGDNLVKHIAFALTCIHWFNPLIWLAFYLMCRDMEMSCDERVLRALGMEEKKAYSMALLSVASGRKLQLGMPIAFSETSTKSRIKNVLKYRKPKFWATLVAGAVIVAVATGLLSNPSGQVVSAGGEPEPSTESIVPEESSEAIKEETYAHDNDLAGEPTNAESYIGESISRYVSTYLDVLGNSPDERDGKKVLTLGLPCGGDDIYEEMLEVTSKYNEQSKDYYVEVVEFVDDWSVFELARGEVMKTLKQGGATDILYLGTLEKEELAMEGMLTDLKAFMSIYDWNTTYVGNILEATTIGDKLYAIGPEFAICTYVADARLAGEDTGWTMRELSEYLEKSESGAHSLSSTADETDVRYIGSPVLDDFVDWETKSCNFQTEDFYKLLEVCKEKETTKNPKKSKSVFDEETQTVKEEVKFGLVTDVHEYQAYNIWYDGHVQSKGFPTENGSGVAALMYEGMGIGSQSSHKEAAWDFIQFYLEERESYHAFPILQDRLYEAYEVAKTPEGVGKDELPKGYHMGIYVYSATDADVQAVVDLTALADREYHYNITYSKILEEEVVAYYDGKISVKDAATRIEERMNEYLEAFR